MAGSSGSPAVAACAFAEYRNALEANEFTLNRDAWTEESIKARTEDLVGRAVERFSL